MTTGERIRQLRVAHQMTQEELGAKVGVKKAAIYKYENGLVVNLKRSVIEKLALALDTTPTYLMGMEENSSSNSFDSLLPKQADLLSTLRKSEVQDQAHISEMIRDFQKLNKEGKKKAVERVHELTEISRYQNINAIAFEQYQVKSRHTQTFPNTKKCKSTERITPPTSYMDECISSENKKPDPDSELFFMATAANNMQDSLDRLLSSDPAETASHKKTVKQIEDQYLNQQKQKKKKK